jgi:hypothetical protein
MKPRSKRKLIFSLPYSTDITEISIHLGLNSTERLVLHLLRSKMNRKNIECWPSMKTIAEEAGVSERQIKRIIKKLKSLRIISVSKRKSKRLFGNNHNVYRFNFPWPDFKSDISSDLKVTSVSHGKGDKTDNPKVTSEAIKSDISNNQKCHQCHANKQSHNKQKLQNKSSSINHEQDDDFSKTTLLKTKPKNTIIKDKNCRNSEKGKRDKNEDDFENRKYLVTKNEATSKKQIKVELTENELKSFYAENIPKSYN